MLIAIATAIFLCESNIFAVGEVNWTFVEHNKHRTASPKKSNSENLILLTTKELVSPNPTLLIPNTPLPLGMPAAGARP